MNRHQILPPQEGKASNMIEPLPTLQGNFKSAAHSMESRKVCLLGQRCSSDQRRQGPAWQDRWWWYCSEMESQPSDSSGSAAALTCSSKMLHLVPTQKSAGSGRCAVPPGHTAGKNQTQGQSMVTQNPARIHGCLGEAGLTLPS